MKHISILIPRGQYSIVNIGGALQILEWASAVYEQEKGQPLFQVELVGLEKPSPDKAGIYTIRQARTFREIRTTDLILIPAVHGEQDEICHDNAELMSWVAAHYRQGTEVASMCIGAYLLASAGLLDGKACSTHWGHAQALQAAYPEIRVVAENIVVECDGIYSCGGAYAFTNLLVYLIEKYGGRELAVLTAKSYMIDIERGSQSPFTIFVGQKNHPDALVKQVQEAIEQGFTHPLTVDRLADAHAVSRRTLERRFRKATGNSIIEYVQRVRMEAAKRQLENGARQVNEVMYAVGYSDPKAFREVFRKHVGLSPLEYGHKYQKLAQA